MSENILENISKLQESYYTTNHKNTIFKQTQKYECASMISQKMDVSVLFEKTLYVLREGEIYFDYTVFKTYIHPEIFDSFLSYVNNISIHYINTISEYTLHLNVNTLSISAFERYWALIRHILQNYQVTVNKMKTTYIYYTPSVVEQMMKILNPFIYTFKDKIVFYSKTESPEKLSAVLSK